MKILTLATICVLLIAGCQKKSVKPMIYGTFSYEGIYSALGNSTKFSINDTAFVFKGDPMDVSQGSTECLYSQSPIPASSQSSYSYFIGSYYYIYLGSNETFGAGTPLPLSFRWGYLTFAFPSTPSGLSIGKTLTFSGGSSSFYTGIQEVWAFISDSVLIAPLGDTSPGVGGANINGKIDSASLQLQITRNSNNGISFKDKAITNTVDGTFSLTAFGSDGSKIVITNGQFNNLPLKN